ncbi:uncharacterized protein LOC128864258 isoform X2 [Anastrepha ludens]|uniref:uncharacterized protein LOC128864258 isoform X2 n=1 Tax=Anastrepha ludens TaxID=28586 RepID=UPI0023AE8695|nr:uncharacterized protein LOC128864258 isoform X2 [Anastrepha ludens]
MGEITNPNENLCVPKWISADYFVKVLEKDGEDYAEISKFTAVAATPPDGSRKHKTYVMKTMLDDDCGGREINNLEMFPKELEMYAKFLPAFEKLYKDVGKPVKLAPRCLLAEARDNRINFVFEDLIPKGFVNADRKKGLNMDGMRRTLQKLAEFHAASAVYFEKNGPYPENFKFSIVKENGYESFKQIFDAKVLQFKEAMATWGLKDADKYLEKFPTVDQYWKSVTRGFATAENSFNVLNHADCWSSNVMYSYRENGTVDDTLLIDYQICKWGSPAEDLLFLITISAAKDIRIREYEHFVAIYHEHLTECLQLLGYKKDLPKLRDLQMDMYRENNSFYAFFAVFNLLAVVLFPTDKDSNINSLLSPSEEAQRFRLKLYTSPAFKEAMLDILPFYYNRGVFNFCDYDDESNMAS